MSLTYLLKDHSIMNHVLLKIAKKKWNYKTNYIIATSAIKHSKNSNHDFSVRLQYQIQQDQYLFYLVEIKHVK